MKNYKKINVWVPLLVALFFVAGMLVGSLLIKTHGPTRANQKFATILNLIENEYVDHVNLDSLIEATLPEMLNKLDPHSVYFSKDVLASVNDELEGSFSGVGIQFTINNDTVVVLEVISGGPSEKVGLMPGDRIVEVDGENIAGVGIATDDVLKRLKGENDTRVNLGIKRNNSKKLLKFDVTRGPVTVSSLDASYLLNDTTGYVRVKRFGRTTYDEFLESLIMLDSQGAKQYVVDLRGNQGGYVEMAVLMANEFLEPGSVIVAQKGRDGKNDKVYLADGTGSFQNANLIVLLDEFSASSSEIFAGAVQDNDRGMLIGRRSFGKGLIQRQAELPDSSAIRLTIARYYTPSGRCIQKDYTDAIGYQNDIIDRYNHGEAFNADSVKVRTEDSYTTKHGRIVYGGGGIMPDIFVPVDTTAITNYYINVLNSGLLQRFAFDYCDMNREVLSESPDILQALPPDDVLLRSFVTFASQNGIPARWYYINISRDLIVNQLKALIARDAIGTHAYYEIINRSDKTVQRALDELNKGNATFPLVESSKKE